MSTTIDQTRVEQFVGHVVQEAGAALNTALVALGDRLGLYRAMADGTPITSAELAEATGTHERYVREWLAAQAASGLVDYDPKEGRCYRLPAEHAFVLADESSPVALAGLFPGGRRGRREPGACPSAFAPGAASAGTSTTTTSSAAPRAPVRRHLPRQLVSRWLPAIDGLVERLRGGLPGGRRGLRARDLSTVLMAEAFPASSFVGYDLTPPRSRPAWAPPRGATARASAPGRPTTRGGPRLASSSTASTTWATRSGRPATRATPSHRTACA